MLTFDAVGFLTEHLRKTAELEGYTVRHGDRLKNIVI